MLNTRVFANGAHTIRVTAEDLHGNTKVFLRTFRIDNVVEADPPRVWADVPGHNEIVSGSFIASGWAVDASGVVSMDFAVDGSPVALQGFTYGTPRQAACTANPDLGDPNCPNVGWRGTLDTTAYSNGAHTLRIRAHDPHGNIKVFNRAFRTENATDSESPRMYVDVPSHGQTVSGDLMVSGWATDASGVSSMTFAVDGSPVTLSGFAYGTPRAGACNANPDLNDPNCPNVGWRGSLNTISFGNGAHTLRVTATDAVGNTKVFNRSFVIQN
jgi:hypothetical protein